MRNLFFIASLCGAVTLSIAFVKRDDPTPKGGLDLSGMDLSVSPREDFFLYSNGAWLRKTEIPPSETAWGSFSILRDNNSKNIKYILEEAAKSKAIAGSVLQRVGDFFASGMDTLTIEKRGYDPIKPILAEIDKIKDYKELVQYSAAHPLEGGGTFIGVGVGPDAKNPDVNGVSMRQAGTGLPEKDYYTKTDEPTVKVREAYKKYITTLFTLTGTEAGKAKQLAEDILALETQLAASHMGRIEMRNPIALYNKFAVKDFAAKVPNLDLENSLVTLRMKTDSIIVAQPKYYETLNEVLPKASIDILKAKMKFAVISGSANILSKPFADANFEYAGRTLNGQKVQQDRWKRISNQTDGLMPDLLGQLYVAKHFKPEAKKRMDELVANLQKVFETRINGLAWMTAETKAEALKKLKAFTPKIGYPNKWKNYEGVVVKRDGYYENVRAFGKWRYEEMLKRLGKPVDKTEWGMTAPTVNASYSPLTNSITFPAGILQWPFFDPNADDAFNYGAIGAVIGHEMTHGFDDQGRQYNYMGMLKNWWKKDDNDQFKQRAQVVVDQYDSFTVLDGLHVKGQLTLGENIADIGGLSVAYEAFKTFTKQGKSNEKIDGFTPDQRFFLAFGQIWRTKLRAEALRLRVNTDPHSPGEFRANGPLSNFEPFYKAFGVQPGDKMYRPENTRVKIW